MDELVLEVLKLVDVLEEVLLIEVELDVLDVLIEVELEVEEIEVEVE